MQIKNFSFVLFVNDIDVSRKFYTNFLELKIDMDFGKNILFKNGLSIWELDNHPIAESIADNKNNQNKSNHFEIYFETEELRSIQNRLQKEGYEFLHELKEEKWGQRSIRFYDPDHHLIEIAETMSMFIRRFIDKGMTVSEVSKRTDISPGVVRKIMRQELKRLGINSYEL